MTYGLTDKQVTQIRQVLAANPRVEQAILFGSRAKGNYKPGSDIDLALKGTALVYKDLLRLDNALDDLNLPVETDLILYHQISDPAVREHVDRVGLTLYSRTRQEAER